MSDSKYYTLDIKQYLRTAIFHTYEISAKTGVGDNIVLDPTQRKLLDEALSNLRIIERTIKEG